MSQCLFSHNPFSRVKDEDPLEQISKVVKKGATIRAWWNDRLRYDQHTSTYNTIFRIYVPQTAAITHLRPFDAVDEFQLL